MLITYEPGVRAALDEARDAGLKDKFEHLILVRDGQHVLRKDGNDKMVDLELEVATGLFKRGDIIVHNHPGELNSLSNADLAFAINIGAKAIYAICDDGSVFKASQLRENVGGMMMGYELESIGFRPAIRAVQRSLPQFEDRANEAHWILKRLSKQGLLKYEYQLGEELDAFVTAFEASVNLNNMGMRFVPPLYRYGL